MNDVSPPPTAALAAITGLVAAQQAFALAGRARDVAFRRDQLRSSRPR